MKVSQAPLRILQFGLRHKKCSRFIASMSHYGTWLHRTPDAVPPQRVHVTSGPGVAARLPYSSKAFRQLCSSAMSTAIVDAKRAAAHEAIDKHLQPHFQAVGIGSGSTVVFCVERIQQLVQADRLDVSKMVFVPTGFQSKQLITDAKLPLRDIDQFSDGGLDIVFDGADEIDTELNCIKGGGACHFQEKLVGTCSGKFIIVADTSKTSARLGEKWRQGVPLEVVPPAVKKVTSDLLKLGAKKVTLRLGGKAKAGPVITDNGNFILDTDFGQIEPASVSVLDKKIKVLVGVVETGLFDYATEAYIGKPDGSFEVLRRKN